MGEGMAMGAGAYLQPFPEQPELKEGITMGCGTPQLPEKQPFVGALTMMGALLLQFLFEQPD